MPQYTDEQKQQWQEQRKAQMSAISEELEKGVREVFQSDQYKTYLTTMSKFPRYSVNNLLLISRQKPDATLVASYGTWKNKFQRQVKRGEKGIRIFAPAPYKQKVERPELDPNTQKPKYNENGEPVTQEVEVTRVAFRVVSVFDVSQTTGKPLPELGVEQLKGDLPDYENFLQALLLTAGIPVTFQPLEEMNGYFNRMDNQIVLREGMSQVQTVKTAIHEIAHARLHSVDPNHPEWEKSLPDRNTREVQAEGVAFTICSHYGISVDDYSFGYIAGWSAGKEIPELKASLKLIQETASKLIDEIDQHLNELEYTVEASAEMETETFSPEVSEGAWQIGTQFLTVQWTSVQWNCVLYDQTLAPLALKQFGEFQTPDEAKEAALSALNLKQTAASIDYTNLQAQIEKSELYGLPPIAFPFVEREGSLTLSTAVEPVVTILHSECPDLRDKMQLPLHVADKLLGQLDATRASEIGRNAPENQCYATSFQIVYRLNGTSHRYEGQYLLGKQEYGLINHVERQCNQQFYHLHDHPEEGDTKNVSWMLNQVIPAFYQQSIAGENQAMAKVLPEPAPFYNVSFQVAIENQDIGADRFHDSNRATLACRKAIDDGLERAHHGRALRPFLEGIVRQYGLERTKVVFARTVQQLHYDNRFHRTNRAYAEQIPIGMKGDNPDRDISFNYILHSHSGIVDLALTSLREMEQEQNAAIDSDRKPSIRQRLQRSRKNQKATQHLPEYSKKRGKSHEL